MGIYITGVQWRHALKIKIWYNSQSSFRFMAVKTTAVKTVLNAIVVAGIIRIPGSQQRVDELVIP